MTIRTLGVLQRIALVYLCTVVIALYCGTRGRVVAILALCVRLSRCDVVVALLY